MHCETVKFCVIFNVLLTVHRDISYNMNQCEILLIKYTLCLLTTLYMLVQVAVPSKA